MTHFTEHRAAHRIFYGKNEPLVCHPSMGRMAGFADYLGRRAFPQFPTCFNNGLRDLFYINVDRVISLLQTAHHFNMTLFAEG